MSLGSSSPETAVLLSALSAVYLRYRLFVSRPWFGVHRSPTTFLTRKGPVTVLVDDNDFDHDVNFPVLPFKGTGDQIFFYKRVKEGGSGEYINPNDLRYDYIWLDMRPLRGVPYLTSYLTLP